MRRRADVYNVLLAQLLHARHIAHRGREEELYEVPARLLTQEELGHGAGLSGELQGSQQGVRGWRHRPACLAMSLE